MDKYVPIQCETHDLYEIACMHRSIGEVIWQDEQGKQQRQSLRYIDIKITGGQEFLIAEQQDGTRVEIRLDRIESIPPG